MSDDDTEHRGRNYPLSPSKMSKTPSWIMVGFLLGAVTVWYLPVRRGEKTAPARPPQAVAVSSTPALSAKRDAQPMSTVEAVFDEWAQYAVWEFDTTEVVLWNKEAGGFTDLYEVRRYGTPARYYFRTIPALTRRIISRGKEVPGCPLQFTETEEQYQEWRQHGRSERPIGDYRPLSAFGSDTKPVPPQAPDSRSISDGAKIAPPKFEMVSPFETAPKKDDRK
ncbi:MAG: hypothetical protein V4773_21175 [Verrucomicrobiota bacterium]